MRGATNTAMNVNIVELISTHAPHARRDGQPLRLYTAAGNFYSRASCEARRFWSVGLRSTISFLLTRLMRGATLQHLMTLEGLGMISTHAPHARRDEHWRELNGENTISTHAPHEVQPSSISTHAPHARRDLAYSLWFTRASHFYSRASCEARHGMLVPDPCFKHFYSRASCEARP